MPILETNLLAILPEGGMLEEAIKKMDPQTAAKNIPAEISPRLARLLFKRVETACEVVKRIEDPSLLENLLVNEKRDRVLLEACWNGHLNLATRERLAQWITASINQRVRKTLLKGVHGRDLLHLVTSSKDLLYGIDIEDVVEREDVAQWVGDPKVNELSATHKMYALKCWAAEESIEVAQVEELAQALMLHPSKVPSFESLQRHLEGCLVPLERILEVARMGVRVGWRNARQRLLKTSTDPRELLDVVNTFTDEEILDEQRLIVRALSSSLDASFAQRYVKVMQEANATVVEGFAGPLPSDVVDVLDTYTHPGFQLLHGHLRSPEEAVRRVLDKAQPRYALYTLTASPSLLSSLVQGGCPPEELQILLTHQNEVPPEVKEYLRSNGDAKIVAEHAETIADWLVVRDMVLASEPSSYVDSVIREVVERSGLDTADKVLLVEHYSGTNLGFDLRSEWMGPLVKEGFLTKVANRGSISMTGRRERMELQSVANKQSWVGEYARLAQIEWDAPMGAGLAKHVRRILHEGLGTDFDRWEVAKSFMETWSGTVPELIEAVDITLHG